MLEPYFPTAAPLCGRINNHITSVLNDGSNMVLASLYTSSIFKVSSST